MNKSIDAVKALALSLKEEEGVIPFIVESNEMSPTIKRGSIIGIDTTCRDYVEGEIYVLDINNPQYKIKCAPLIRRIFGHMNQGRVCGDNPLTPVDENVSIKDVLPQIVGRVKWIIQKIY
jgi:phage repressor protein C with HTH and peptisase S24 domain